MCWLLEDLQQQVPDTPLGVLLEQAQEWHQQLQQGQLDMLGLRQKLKSLEAIAHCTKRLRLWQPNEWRRCTNSTVRGLTAAALICLTPRACIEVVVLPVVLIRWPAVQTVMIAADSSSSCARCCTASKACRTSM
jgi:hypothetical protein